MNRYAVFFKDTAIQSLPKSQRARDAVYRYVASVSENPFQAGDYQEKDGIGRVLESKLVRNVVVTWWADHAVKEIKVTKIGPADRDS